ncbi:MAG: Coenzyme F420 hydrogenase/dehydrogenase, beta subunit C-terminal domain [Christensenellales bacterium]
MRGSKYVQSDAADAIGNAVSLLKRDIPVLFSGTPCQISGLMAALGGTKTDKLLTVDFVCHGVPSPGVFASYLAELEKERGSRVRAYAFRDKRLGWKNFSVVATFENGETHTGTQTTDPYLYGFLQNLYLRPSCHECGQLRGKRHAADITLADLWGAETICPERDDDTGLSLVMTHTQKGRQALDAIGAQVTRFAVQNMESMTRMNPSLVQPSKPHDKRAAFFKRYRSHGFESERVMKLLRGPSAAERAAKRIAHLPAGAMRRIKNLITK